MIAVIALEVANHRHSSNHGNLFQNTSAGCRLEAGGLWIATHTGWWGISLREGLAHLSQSSTSRTRPHPLLPAGVVPVYTPFSATTGTAQYCVALPGSCCGGVEVEEVVFICPPMCVRDGGGGGWNGAVVGEEGVMLQRRDPYAHLFPF